MKRAGIAEAPVATPRRAPTTVPRWQLSPPTLVLAMRPASKSEAYFQARYREAGKASLM